nr:transcription termination factor Rho [Puniceicoccus vermicola]
MEESFQKLYDESVPPVLFNDLYDLPLQELRERSRRLQLDLENAPSRPQILERMMKHFEEKKNPVLVEGCLEVLDDGFGMVVFPEDSYRLKPLCPFVSESLIEHHGLQRGHMIKVFIQAPREGESCPIVLKVQSVMGSDIKALEKITPFTELVPYYPLDRILLENSDENPENNLSMRVVDLISPIGFGQRGLIVAPPRTGKTVLLQGIAHSIQMNYPDSHLIVLLIDERPEEVTDFRRRVRGEVISSTFDETAGSHVHAAEMVIEKARRMVETGRDVVILLDSITRLARAYNTLMPSSGKILSGGVEANALQKPKRFFGSARNIEDGGSLTIMGTALVDTGSKMDEVIFEEFKGTGNMELHLDRSLVDKRVFPALAMDRSGTRKEELLYHPDEMQKVYSLRRATKGVPPVEAMEMLIQRVKKTRSNAEFLMTLSR